MVDVAEIKIWGESVGAVRWDDAQQLAYFQYDKDFVKYGWDLSPIKMPIKNGSLIYSFPELRVGRGISENTFKGLPGLLSDVLPDKYGNRLINTWLVQQGRPENSINPIEMLCFIGKRGMGALEFEPSQRELGGKNFSIEMNGLVNIAQKMLNDKESFTSNLNQESEKAMMDILKIGTSAGGARPKAIVAYNKKTKAFKSGQGTVSEGFEHWLIKLDGVSGVQFGDSTGWGRVEFAYYLMAKDGGIEMNECFLLEENNRAHFMTKRFDRDGNVKHHIQSLCGLQHYDFNDMYGYSYEQLFQTMRRLKLTYPEAEQMFRRMVFNVIATNYDDHTKNFSFILKKDGKWELAPAYDLCFSYDPTNHWVSQQTLSINGKRLNILKEDLMKIAKDNHIKNGAKIISQINDVVHSWENYAIKAGVHPLLSQKINEHLNVYSNVH